MNFVLAALIALAAATSHALSLAEWESKCQNAHAIAKNLRQQYEIHAPKTTESALRISLPVEAYESGALKTVLTAERAKISLKSDYVWGEGVDIVQLSPSGATQTVVKAENCIVDRIKRRGWVKGRATADHGDNHIEGRDVYVSIEDLFLFIYSNACVTAGGVDLGGSGGKNLRLAGDSAAYSRTDGIVMFSGSVNLKETDKTIKCDKAYAFLEGTNDVRRVVAIGNVRFNDASRNGGCPRADYDRRKERLTLHSDLKNLAFIEELGANKWRLEGRQIKFWPKSEQVEVDNAVIYADTSSSKGGALEDIIR